MGLYGFVYIPEIGHFLQRRKPNIRKRLQFLFWVCSILQHFAAMGKLIQEKGEAALRSKFSVPDGLSSESRRKFLQQKYEANRASAKN